MMAQMASIPARVGVRCHASSARASSTRASSSFFGNNQKALAAKGVGASVALAAGATTTRAFFGGNSGTVSGSAHDFTVKDIDGKSVKMSKYKGKTLLIVNVASACGLTDQNYKELVTLYNQYKNKNFEILAFPCNQFGAQEPGSNKEIKDFAKKYGVTFQMMDKVDVNGDGAEPLYAWMKEAKKEGGLAAAMGNDIKWNFGKFLVDGEGKVVERYVPTTSPLAIEPDIKPLLA